MPELRDLLATHAAELPEPALPPYDGLAQRARGRRRRREFVAVAAAALVVGGGLGAIVVTGGGEARHTTHLMGEPVREKDCGTDVQQRPDRPAISAADWQCFVGAMSTGGPARLLVTTLTVEGDPVYLTYSTQGNGVATILTDSRLDAFSGGVEVTSATCRQPDPRPVARGMFLACSSPAQVSPPTTLAFAMCSHAIRGPVATAAPTTVGAVRTTNVGGPWPGEAPGRRLFADVPAETRAAWCWRPLSPGKRVGYELLVVTENGDVAHYFTWTTLVTPPTGPPSIH